jgi:hypothetical protein
MSKIAFRLTALLRYLLHAGILSGFLFDPKVGGDMFFRNGLHGVISQKIELFAATAVRTTNPT